MFNSDGTLYFLPEPDPEPDEPEPGPDPDEQDEQEIISNYIQSLYYTNRGSDDLVDNLYEELLVSYNDPEAFYTMLVTEGNVALAKALLVSNANIGVNDQIKFVKKDTNMPNASERYVLSVNGKIAIETDGNTELNFNQFGDIYGPSDIKGVEPTLSYPYANQSRDDL